MDGVHMKRCIAGILAVVILFVTGCQGKDNDQKKTKSGVNEPTSFSAQDVDNKKVLGLCPSIMDMAKKGFTSGAMTEMEEFVKEINEAEGNAKKLTALMLATDISFGQLGMVNQDILLYMAGKALTAYPEHPIVLNNAASVLFDSGKTDTAIALFMEAIKGSPQNPVFLINLANAYIQKGDFASAEKYARQSLSADPDYSAAYQVLTTCHLEKGHDMLAAETMVKSTKNCFNDVSISQFTSFLQEVESLEAEDEFPLKEAFIDELYEIARQDAEYAYEYIDTPEGQIKLQPFPAIGTLDAFIAKSDSFVKQEDLMWAKAEEATLRFVDAELVTGVDRYINGKVRKLEGEYPVRGSLRQIFAFKVLSSFYKHKYKQAYSEFKKSYDVVYNDYLKVREDIGTIMANQANATDDALASLNIYSGGLEQVVKLNDDHFQKIYNTRRDYYNEVKQITEEYWLRSGGMLKYITDDICFQYFLAERDFIIYHQLTGALAGMGALSWIFEFDKGLNERAREILGKNEIHPEESAASAEIYLQPDVKYPSLPMYKEKNDKEKELNLWWFSGTMSKGSLSLKFTTPISSHLAKLNRFDGRVTTANAYGVNPGIGALTKGLLGNKRYKELQETVWKRYNIGLPDNPEEGKSGRYRTRDQKGRVVDQGIIKIQEASLGVPGVKGASIEVSRQVMKSYITGVTEVEKSKSIGFSNLKAKK
jgi:tetratricopeptide (TPR) repeat protein